MLISAIIDDLVTEIGGPADDSTFEAMLLVQMKSALRKIPAYIRDRLFLYQSTLTLAAGGYTVDLSTLSPGFIKENAVWYLDADSRRIPIYSPPSRKYFHQVFTPVGSGSPQYYIVYGKTMQFDKKADVAKTIGIEYFKEVSSIATTDTFFGDDRILDAFCEFTLMNYFRKYEEDENKAVTHERLGKEILREIEGDYEAQEMGGHVSIQNT